MSVAGRLNRLAGPSRAAATSTRSTRFGGASFVELSNSRVAITTPAFVTGIRNCATHRNLSAKNLSFVLEKQHNVRFEDRPIPVINDPYDVKVNIKYTGICGSDVHYWTHGAIGNFVVKAPMVLGHESAGIVEEVGDKVKSLKVGDRVALEPGIPCRRCVRCLEGTYNLCEDMKFAATPPNDGTLAKYYTVPEDFAYKLPDSVSLEEGAVVEPLSVGVHVTKQANVKPGDSVIVFGAGPVGLLCCAVARAFGATKIICVDINEERLNFAQTYAATHLFRSQRVSAEENASNLISECELGAGADVAIDATGAEPCIQTAIHALRVGGTYVQAGMGKDEITWPIAAMCSKELTVKGSFRYSGGDYKLAIQLIESGMVDVKPLITGSVAFDQAEIAFEKVRKSEGIKTLIRGPDTPDPGPNAIAAQI